MDDREVCAVLRSQVSSSVVMRCLCAQTVVCHSASPSSDSRNSACQSGFLPVSSFRHPVPESQSAFVQHTHLPAVLLRRKVVVCFMMGGKSGRFLLKDSSHLHTHFLWTLVSQHQNVVFLFPLNRYSSLPPLSTLQFVSQQMM